MERLIELIREAHRRSLWQVLGIYLAGSWVAFEVVSTLTESLDLPAWVPGLALVLLVVGLPIVVATAFVQEGPPEREDGEAVAAPEEAPARGDDAPEDRRATPRSLFTWRNAVVGGGLAFCLLFGIAGLWVLFQEDGGPIAPPEARAGEAAPAIAVLPFSVRGEEMEMLREGMVDVLSHALDGAAGFRSISNRTVLARWREHAPDDGNADLPTHLQVAREAGARYAIVGSAVRLGEEARLVGKVYEARSGDQIASASVEGDVSDLGGLADRLAVETLKSLLAGNGSSPGVDVGRVLTESPEALRAFLEGERHLRRFEQTAAAEDFRRALASDSAFALAHLRLVEVHTWGETLDFARQNDHLQAAYRHRSRLTDRDALLVEAYTAPVREEVRLLRSAVSRYPDEAMAWYGLGEALTHSPQLLPRAPAIERAFDRALDLDPRRPGFYPHAIEMAITFRRDSSRAAELVERYAELSRATGPYQFDIDPRAGDLAVRLAFGNGAEQSRVVAAFDTLPPGLAGAVAGYLRVPPYWHLAAPLLETHVRRGEPDALRAVSRRILANGRLLFEGRVEEALELMREETLPPEDLPIGRGYRWPRILLRARTAGLPVPDSVLDRVLAAPDDDPAVTVGKLFWRGIWAHQRGEARGVARARTLLISRADGLEEAGHSGAAGTPRRALRLLDARVALGEGRAEEAAAVLEEEAEGNWMVQWWLGEAYLRAGRFADAERAFGTYGFPETFNAFYYDPPVRERWARALEALDRHREAARAYGYFADHWSAAEPAVRSRVEAARERGEALGGGGSDR